MGKTVAIILAGGRGERFGDEKAKQFVKIAGKSVIEHTLDKFENHPLIDEIYIVIHPDYYNFVEELVRKNLYTKVKKILYGGETRQESSRIGVYALDDDVEKVLIHDAVRPFIDSHIITEVINALSVYCAVDVAVPSTDTIIKIDNERYIVEVPERRELLRGQTPQGFRKDIIVKAHKLAEEEGITNATDDCSLVVRYNLSKVYVVDGDESNIKITYPQDVYIADRLFQLKKLSFLDVFDLKRLEGTLRELQGKVIVVFGGTSGIGKEIFEISKKYEALPYAFSRRTGTNVASYEEVKQSLDDVYTENGRIDIVINTAGILKRSPIYNTSVNEIEEQIKVNLLGSIYVSKASIPYLHQSKGSLILFTSSSYTRGREGYSPYSASKAAIVNFTQALADEVRDLGIRVNAICPERTDTPMRWKNFGKEPKSTLLDPKTVAYITLLVSTQELTGQIIDVRKKDEMLLKNLLGDKF